MSQAQEASTILDQALRVRVSQKLYENRTIVLCGEIDADLAKRVVEQLLALSFDSTDPITMYLHSPGGHVESADTLFDMISFIPAPISIVGTGWVASAGAHIYVAAPKESRYCLPNTRFLLHQPMGGGGGRATDLEIEAEQILKIRARLNKIIADKTGQPIKRVEKDTERNFWMTAEEAKEYGLVGKIISSISELKK
jgi:ATP-dependent Clp protease, protease subunit